MLTEIVKEYSREAKLASADASVTVAEMLKLEEPDSRLAGLISDALKGGHFVAEFLPRELPELGTHEMRERVLVMNRDPETKDNWKAEFEEEGHVRIPVGVWACGVDAGPIWEAKQLGIKLDLVLPAPSHIGDICWIEMDARLALDIAGSL